MIPKLFTRTGCLLLGLLFSLATPVNGEVTADLRNPSIDGFNPGNYPGTTAGQFGGIGTTASVPNTGDGPDAGIPTNGSLRLARSHAGFAFSGSVPRYAIGDIIAYPLVTFTDDQGRDNPLRRRPVDEGDGNFLYITAEDPISATPQTFNANISSILWSPHAVEWVLRDTSGDDPEETVVTEDTPGAIQEEGFVYASRAGSFPLYWRTKAPVKLTAGSEPVYRLVRVNVGVSSGSNLPVRRIFWTENSFEGPPVEVPIGEIQQVRIAYTDKFPAKVPDGQEYGADDENQDDDFTTPLPSRTLWFDEVTNSLNAYNRQGRVLIEFLGETRTADGTLRRQVGIEVVDVIREPAATSVNVPIGERLYPLDPEQAGNQAYAFPEGTPRFVDSLEQIRQGLAHFEPSLVLNSQALAQGFTALFPVEGTDAYYAQKETESAADVQMFWLEEGIGGLRWPRFLNRYKQFWPENLGKYLVNLRSTDDTVGESTLPVFGDSVSVQLVSQDDATESQAGLTGGTDFEVDLDGSDPVNRSLLLLRSGDGFWYVRVESVLDSIISDARYSDYYRDTEVDSPADPLVALVGERLTPPAGADSVAAWVDLSQGDAIHPEAYINPFTEGIEAAEGGAVIPVNAAGTKAGQANDQLAVWWFERIDPPATAGDEMQPVWFPSYFTRYQLEWPTDAPQIILASNAGSGDLEPKVAQGSIYTQNDPAAIGYNANEEHALLAAGRAYALRDDLNFPDTTSAPYVLISYTEEDNRPAVEVYRVLRENEQYTFDYNARAGTVLQPPAPLSFMPPPLVNQGGQMVSKNEEVTPAGIDDANSAPSHASADYDIFTFEDRKGLTWVYRGPHDPASLTERPKLGMQFYYATLDGFAFPEQSSGANQAPPVGTVVPYLRPFVDENNPALGFAGNSQTGTPLTITFTPYWPDEFPDDPKEVPSLQFAETLVKPKFGLPGLAGATSAEILYDQSSALFTPAAPEDPLVSAAVLHDPTRQKTYFLGSGLGTLPGSIATSTRAGRVYFQNLPPHLQSNFYFDPGMGPGSQPAGGLVLQGEFKDEIVGEDYLLLNALGQTDIEILKGLVADSDPDAGAWKSAIDSLTTTVETFVPNPDVPGTFAPDPDADEVFNVKQLVEITNEDMAVDSYALTAVGGGRGYITLILGNGEAFTDPGEPVQIHILRVGDELYRGQVKPITPANPLAEQITMQHTGDFAAQTDDYEFEWFYSPPVNGQPPINMPGEVGVTWFNYASEGPRISFGGDQPLLTLTDNYFVMRYRPKVGHFLRPDSSVDPETLWSDWTDPALAEGWIKRVLAGINPFNQRVSDFYNNAINTDVSLLTQAGTRWEGDVPLTLESAQEAGLIEIYETLLRRAINFTIDGTPPVDYGPANDALLLAAGYLNDLYLALANEAFADASNPLIALDVDPSRILQQQSLPSEIGTTIQNTATARFAFEGQVPELIDEEFVLLRGRDDFLVPGARTAPVYNRFFWNFTRGIDAGEVIYAMNYNIRDKSGDDADGIIDAADAARQYPQGHGDAYGHYLTALKNYYRLLSDPEFTWTPRVEAVNILGAPVTVDYQDERKLAAAAVGLGRTASRILDLERRKLPVSTESGWSDLREAEENPRTEVVRVWGLEDWASRAGQGNYLHWVTANAMLPEEDTQNEGLQKIDRHTVPELDELAALGSRIQSHLDAANERTNALGLAADSVLFDLSPAELDAGNTHFDQILDRAKRALANAAVAHERTIDTNNLLRSLENQADDYSFTVAQEEIALENRLLDIYGMPYRGDIGVGKTYPQGYAGPDFLKFMYINRPYIFERDVLFNDQVTFNLALKNNEFLNRIITYNGTDLLIGELTDMYATFYEPDAAGEVGSKTIPFTLNLSDGPYLIATSSMGRRDFEGAVQNALEQVMAAEEALYVKARSMDIAKTSFKRRLDKFEKDTNALNLKTGLDVTFETLKLTTEKTIGAIDLILEVTGQSKKTLEEINLSVLEALPKSVGTSNDVTSAARAALLATKVAGNTVLSSTEIAQKTGKYIADLGVDLAAFTKDQTFRGIDRATQVRAEVAALRGDYASIYSSFREVDAANIELQRALEAYQNVLIDGDTILAERETFRKRAAAVIQGSRIRDVGFRAFRTESLEQYKILFDQAARYTWLAAKAYDYETSQLGTEQGREFFAKITSSRALGLVGEDGEPQFAGSGTGDPGLSSLLAQLEQDWQVAKGRLGINNPDQYGTLFSLRRELFGLPYAGHGAQENHNAWKDRLRSSLVEDLRGDPDIAAHALLPDNPDNLPIPGFVITFNSTIETGKNFFSKELVAGDSAFSSASFATKINSVGVVFDGYKGMDPYAPGSFSGTPTHDDPNALSATPYVYLIPTGLEHMRTPALDGGEPTLRSWSVHDHAMPLPFDIGGGGFGQETNWTSASSLSEPFFHPRKHQPFRAVDDPTLFYSSVPEEFTNTRLIGRSVWNDQWKLVIPATTLLADPDQGAERFLESVRDIKLFLRTYSHSGN